MAPQFPFSTSAFVDSLADCDKTLATSPSLARNGLQNVKRADEIA